MALICYSCGKKSISGNLVSHAKNRTKRRFKPNLHVYWIKDGGKNIKAKFCAKCMRRVKAIERELNVPKVSSEPIVLKAS